MCAWKQLWVFLKKNKIIVNIIIYSSSFIFIYINVFFSRKCYLYKRVLEREYDYHSWYLYYIILDVLIDFNSNLLIYIILY